MAQTEAVSSISTKDEKSETHPQDFPSENGKNPLEWCVFGLGVLLVAATLGFLGYQAFHFDASLPRLETHIGEPVRVGGQFLVPVEVTNRGGTTAQSVEVEVTHAKEAANFSLDMVPRKGMRRGFVTFAHPLRKGALQARVTGFQES